MKRRGSLLLLALVVAGAAAQQADARTGVRATLTRPIPRHALVDTQVTVAFTLRDAGGRPVDARHVFVRLICPTRDASSLAFASSKPHPNGRYVVLATVPPGGLGYLQIGVRGSTDVRVPITNNPLTGP